MPVIEEIVINFFTIFSLHSYPVTGLVVQSNCPVVNIDFNSAYKTHIEMSDY